jgi:hypothetical protein
MIMYVDTERKCATALMTASHATVAELTAMIANVGHTLSSHPLTYTMFYLLRLLLRVPGKRAYAEVVARRYLRNTQQYCRRCYSAFPT